VYQLINDATISKPLPPSDPWATLTPPATGGRRLGELAVEAGWVEVRVGISKPEGVAHPAPHPNLDASKGVEHE